MVNDERLAQSRIKAYLHNPTNGRCHTTNKNIGSTFRYISAGRGNGDGVPSKEYTLCWIRAYRTFLSFQSTKKIGKTVPT
jgi:hypothetical protein